VWADLKAEDFFVIGDADSDALPGVKGVDVASAMLKQYSPISYNPDTCPPELARVCLGSSSGLKKFTLDYTFDIWSYGMLLYELGTGRQYFSDKLPEQITRVLASGDFKVDVSAVQDSDLRDLIERCLNTAPEKRPSIQQVLSHPYLKGQIKSETWNPLKIFR